MADQMKAYRSRVLAGQALVDCGVYIDGQRLPGTYSPRAALDKVRELRRGLVWVGLYEPDQHELQAMADVFNLHPLAVADAVQAHQRPRLNRYDDTLVLVLKTVRYVAHESISDRHIVETGEITTFVGPEFVITVRHGDFSGLAGLRQELQADPGRLRLGPYAVMHAVAHHVVESYRDLATLIQADIDTMQGELFAPGRETDIERIYLLKREIVELRRAISPLSGALQRITWDYRDLTPAGLMGLMRDVIDLQASAAERINSYDDMLSSLVDGAVAMVGIKQNTDMRKISAWAAIAAVVMVVTGIFSLNFENQPELHWALGYFATLGGIAGICVYLYLRLRHNRWL